MTSSATSPAMRVSLPTRARSKFFEALFPRERWTPSQWAERAPRILPPSVSAEPGPWSNRRAPYLAGIMDAVAQPGVEEVVFLKAVQVGFSEATRNTLGYWIDLDPGPCLIVMPDEQSGKEMI